MEKCQEKGSARHGHGCVARAPRAARLLSVPDRKSGIVRPTLVTSEFHGNRIKDRSSTGASRGDGHGAALSQALGGGYSLCRVSRRRQGATRTLPRGGQGARRSGSRLCRCRGGGRRIISLRVACARRSAVLRRCVVPARTASLHKHFGEEIAILVGDALIVMAFNAISSMWPGSPPRPRPFWARWPARPGHRPESPRARHGKASPPSM